MTDARKGVAKFKQWLNLLRELGYNKDDRAWFADFWWERHDDEGQLMPPGMRRSSTRGQR